VENEMYGIGETARESGLGVSALRFYDRAGVLVPAWVDPVSGYRWYGTEQLAEARVLARLRRAGMPLPDVRLVLAGWSGTDTWLVRELLRAHLRRLEDGLSDARTEFSALLAQLDLREHPMTAPHTTPATRPTASAAELAAALDAVRFAAGTDPELPMLAGVLFDLEGGTLRVVATDRYRMAVSRVAVAGHEGERVQVIVPVALADAMRALLGGGEQVRLSVDEDGVGLETGSGRAAGAGLDHEFPDYRRLLRLPAGRRVPVDVAAFAEAVRGGPVREHESAPRGVSVLRVTGEGTVAVRADGVGGDDGDAGDGVAVNRDYLLHALTAAAVDRLVLELGSPTTPIVLRHPTDEGTFSLLMPVRLED
jgi:DNA-binding transcriptional MerR regulator